MGKFEKLVETHSEIESRIKKKKKKDKDRACPRLFFFFFLQAEKLSWSSKIRDPVFYNMERKDDMFSDTVFSNNARLKQPRRGNFAYSINDEY